MVTSGCHARRGWLSFLEIVEEFALSCSFVRSAKFIEHTRELIMRAGISWIELLGFSERGLGHRPLAGERLRLA